LSKVAFIGQLLYLIAASTKLHFKIMMHNPSPTHRNSYMSPLNDQSQLIEENTRTSTREEYIPAQGYQGMQGQGYQGMQGQGYQGMQGMQGLGYQGMQGMQGQGYQGMQGRSSYIPAQGYQGMQGMQGMQGRSSYIPARTSYAPARSSYLGNGAPQQRLSYVPETRTSYVPVTTQRVSYVPVTSNETRYVPQTTTVMRESYVQPVQTSRVVQSRNYTTSYVPMQQPIMQQPIMQQPIMQPPMARTVLIRPVAARLSHRTDFILFKMDPFVEIAIGPNRYKTTVHKNGGKRPQWNETFTHEMYGNEGDMSVIVWDQDRRKVDLVGETKINLAQVLANGSSSNWYELFWRGKTAGRILINLELV
jgi:hypothetical protein